MEIKEGNIADLPLIVNNVGVFFELAQDGFGQFLTLSPMDFADNIHRVVQAGGKYWVLWNEGEFAGIIMGGIARNFYDNSQTIASCLFVAVLPEYQRSQWGSKLMAKFEDWAMENGADFVAYNGYDPKFIRTMKRKGYKQIEVKLMKEL